MNKTGNKPIDLLREVVLSSFENFIYFFQKEYNGYKPHLYDYQKKIVADLEGVIEGRILKEIINLPPRYRKTEIAVKMFIPYCLALNPKAKFIHTSYSKSLALDNSEAVRNLIKSEPYQKLFPYVQIRKDTDAKEKWYTTEGGGMYSTSSGGQITGFGAGSSVEEYEDNSLTENMDKEFMSEFFKEIEKGKFGGAIIMDDANKPDDADSPQLLARVNNRFDNTIQSRRNSRYTPIINIQQRVAINDLSGYLMKKGGWNRLVLKAISDEGEALCPAIHTLEELYKLKKENDVVFDTQYQQTPSEKEGLMYSEINTCDIDRKTLIEKSIVRISSTDANLTDGNDYFVTWFWALYEGRLFIYDVIMEQLAPHNVKDLFIQKHHENKIDLAVIEQNNQQTFIEEIRPYMPSNMMKITATTNKLARIISKAHLVGKISFVNSEDFKFKKALEHLKQFNKNGTSEDNHDDPEDALTLGLDYWWHNYPMLFLDN